MKVMKLWYHIIAAIQYVFYKAIYGSKLTIGKHVTWRRGFSIMKDREAKIVIGDNCFFNNDCSIASNHLISIGGVLFGEGVKIYDHNHRFQKDRPIKEQGFSDGEVHIGEHCWIGSGVIILKGADISDNCVIGAGCVISGFVPEGSIVTADRHIKIDKVRSEVAQ